MQQAQESFENIWTPQPGPQLMATTCPADIIVFGGSRGGGKSDCAIGRQIIGAMQYGYAWNGLFLRKNFKHFNDLRRRIDELIRWGLPATRVGGDQQTNVVKFENGARILLTAIEREEQLEFFQGQQFTEISVEEATQFGFIDRMIDKLRACLRSPHGVPCHMFVTCNPGGPGHGVVRNRFVAPEPKGGKVIHDGDNRSAIFIPSNVADNQVLCKNDPNYVSALKSIKDPKLRRAWLEGDWDVVLGGYFDDVWDEYKHVLRQFRIPKHWPRLMGLDWGTAKPFSVGWFAISGGDVVPELGYALPRGSIVHYAEWYGCTRDNLNEGIRLNSSQVAEGILQREQKRGEHLLEFDRIADPAIFKEDDGPTIAEKFADHGVVLRRGDNRRIFGWDEVRKMLAGKEDDHGKLHPMFYVFENCQSFRQTLPTLERDENNWEDVDTEGIDHIADMTRYVLMSRPGHGVSRNEAVNEEMHKTYFERDWDEILSEAVSDDGLGPIDINGEVYNSKYLQ